MSKRQDRLCVKTLSSISPYCKDGTDAVAVAASEMFLQCIKTQPHVHETFFPEVTSDPLAELMDPSIFPFEDFATAFVSWAIANIKDDYGFHASIEKIDAERVLLNCYDSLKWKKLGFALYSICYPGRAKDPKSGVEFREFLEKESQIWADKLVAEIMEPDWMKAMLKRIVKGHVTEHSYNREMNDLFVKLHLLDPQSVIPTYHHLLKQRALPFVNLELATRDYLGGAMDWRSIKPEIIAAENKLTCPINTSLLSLQDIDTYRGVGVEEFIVTACRNAKLWTGKRPDNHKKSTTKDRCLLM